MSPTVWQVHNSDIFPVKQSCSSQLNRFIIVNENNWKYTERLVSWLKSVCNCIRDASQCSRTDYLPVSLWWSSAVCKCSWCSVLSGRIINEVHLSSHPSHRFSCYVLNLYHPFLFNIDFDLEGTHKKKKKEFQLQCNVVICNFKKWGFLQPTFRTGCRPPFENSLFRLSGDRDKKHIGSSACWKQPILYNWVLRIFPVKQRPDHRDELEKCVLFKLNSVRHITCPLYL